ncbi:Protein kinase domain [Macleaya cordata]|uniref:Protein kinase domain n=1 Tax=Macleaya cordata TaxID=56857 RepID=A0A200Q404_MACCD|nr:Protein kinase domain [Macleaya cordata]
MILKTHRNLFLLVVIFSFSFNSSQASTHCNRSCGNATKNLQLPFPFGFSEGCEIRLNCSEKGEIFIGEFRVQNVTSDHLIVDLPGNCSRRIESLSHLFNRNYALTWRNGLLLGNCSSKIQRCRLPTTVVETNFEFKGCNNLSCFSNTKAEQGQGFMNFTSLNHSNCGILFSSVALANVAAPDLSSSVSLQFQTLQLEWWLEGSCSDGCSSNANCRNVSSPVNDQSGFRCSCNDGFVGDGFRDGEGCRRVLAASSSCNPSKYMSGRCGGTTRVGVLIGGIVAGAFSMAGLALVCYFIRRRSTSQSQKDTKRLLSEAVGSCNIPFYSYREIERATNSFSLENRLGTGAYGTVYAGKFHSNEWVAIKKIRHRDTDGIEQVMNEVKLLSSVSHPNLVRLLGYCLERSEQILVYEYMPNGTLSQHLQRERGTGLPWTIRLTIATETAQAIAHLHSAKNPPIYHRDIKSSNILLDYNFNSKVADFGLSRVGVGITESSHISTAPQGTPGYLDPQYHQNFHLSDKSDVYSFGVVLVEIITALKVVDFSRHQSQVNLAALAIEKIGKGCVDDIIDPFLEPHRDAWTLSSVHKVAELAFRCLAFHRDMRPSMMEVASELEYIRQSAWAPMADSVCASSSAASSCSTAYDDSEKPQGLTVKKVVESQRLVVPERSSFVTSIEEVKDSSPVSVHDPWFSEQSSPSSNSLLENAIN